MALDVGELGFVRASQLGEDYRKTCRFPLAMWIGVFLLFGLKKVGLKGVINGISFKAPKNRYLKCCRNLVGVAYSKNFYLATGLF